MTHTSDPDHGFDHYRPDLALVHDKGFGFHADRCAPGILELLAPVLRGGGLVLELGCGSGALTNHLVDAGHRVIATDASEAMVDLTRRRVPGTEATEALVLGRDPLPAADAVVSVGHVLSYLPDEATIDSVLTQAAGTLSPGGVLAVDICDLSWGTTRIDAPATSRSGADWAVMISFSQPEPARFVRDITTFLDQGDGCWRRDDERHVNVLVDTSQLPGLLGRHGVRAEVGEAFGTEELPAGLHTLLGRRG